jgi:hypothetical protein
VGNNDTLHNRMRLIFKKIVSTSKTCSWVDLYTNFKGHQARPRGLTTIKGDHDETQLHNKVCDHDRMTPQVVGQGSHLCRLIGQKHEDIYKVGFS